MEEINIIIISICDEYGYMDEYKCKSSTTVGTITMR
jgi:hypothetical protein